jgi:putative membrane protein
MAANPIDALSQALARAYTLPVESPPLLFPRLSDRGFYAINAVLSAAALAFLAYILMVREGSGAGGLAFMPAVNASLNALSATCLTLAYLAIRKKRVDLHRALMGAAFVASSLFLVGYLVYHFVHGDTRYPAEAPLRSLYLFVLASHVLLSIGVVPLVLTSFFFALRGHTAKHRKVAKITLPLWLYVSVTGVVIFAMLRAAGA